MCIWKSDYFVHCGHQPVYLLETCARRKLVLDSYTDRCVVRACSEMDIQNVDSINAACYDCVPEYPRPSLIVCAR